MVSPGLSWLSSIPFCSVIRTCNVVKRLHILLEQGHRLRADATTPALLPGLHYARTRHTHKVRMPFLTCSFSASQWRHLPAIHSCCLSTGLPLPLFHGSYTHACKWRHCLLLTAGRTFQHPAFSPRTKSMPAGVEDRAVRGLHLAVSSVSSATTFWLP